MDTEIKVAEAIAQADNVDSEVQFRRPVVQLPHGF